MTAFTLEEVETIINEYTGGEGARAIAISNSELLALVNDYEIVDVAVTRPLSNLPSVITVYAMKQYHHDWYMKLIGGALKCHDGYVVSLQEGSLVLIEGRVNKWAFKPHVNEDGRVVLHKLDRTVADVLADSKYRFRTLTTNNGVHSDVIGAIQTWYNELRAEMV